MKRKCFFTGISEHACEGPVNERGYCEMAMRAAISRARAPIGRSRFVSVMTGQPGRHDVMGRKAGRMWGR